MRRVDIEGPLLLWTLGLAGLLTAIWMGGRFGFIGYVIGLMTGPAVMLGILSGATVTWVFIQGLLFNGIPAVPGLPERMLPRRHSHRSWGLQDGLERRLDRAGFPLPLRGHLSEGWPKVRRARPGWFT